MNIIKKINSNLSKIDRTCSGYAAIVVAVAIINIVLWVFVPVTTIIQDILVLLTSGVVLFHAFDVFFGSNSDDSVQTIYECDCWVFGTFVSVILWMFPISLLWSIIPLSLAFLLARYFDIIPGYQLFSETFFVVLILLVVSCKAQSNLDVIQCLQKNPEPEIVVVDNISLSENVLFVNHCNQEIKFHNLKTHNQAYDLDIKQGDTIKIVRHPNYPDRIIKVSK